MIFELFDGHRWGYLHVSINRLNCKEKDVPERDPPIQPVAPVNIDNTLPTHATLACHPFQEPKEIDNKRNNRIKANNSVKEHIDHNKLPTSTLSFPADDPQNGGFSAKYLTAKYLGSNVNSCFIATSNNQSDTTILGSMFPFFAISSNLGHSAFSAGLGDVSK